LLVAHFSSVEFTQIHR